MLHEWYTYMRDKVVYIHKSNAYTSIHKLSNDSKCQTDRRARRNIRYIWKCFQFQHKKAWFSLNWSSLSTSDWIFIYRIYFKNRKLLWNQYPLSNMCWQLHSIGAGDVINRCDKIKSDHIQYSSVLFTIVLRIRRFVILGVQCFFFPFRFVSCWNSNILLAHFSAFYFQKFVLIVMR